MLIVMLGGWGDGEKTYYLRQTLFFFSIESIQVMVCVCARVCMCVCVYVYMCVCVYVSDQASH